MLRRSSASLVLAALLLPSPRLFGDEWLSKVVPGDRVRFKIARSREGKLAGQVVENDGDVLLIALSGDRPPMKVPVATLDRLEVQRGQRGFEAEGAILGLVLGGYLLTAAGMGCLGGASPGQSCSGSGGSVVVAAALGAVVGYSIKKDRWERVRRKRVRVGVAPVAGRGLGAQLSLGF